jgi:putative molybdopterin biosynthesis protein
VRVNSERGRTEYLLVTLVQEHRPEAAPAGAGGPAVARDSFVAFPMGKGSGSVTTFSGADGFVVIDQHTEIVEAGSTVDVQLLAERLRPADLVVIGSHCAGLDYLLGQLQRRGFSVKSLYVGSQGGLAAARRGQCDLAGIHLLDPPSGVYNRPLVTADLELIEGYGRLQGIVYRRGDARFSGKDATRALAAALADRVCTMVNRNAGSGTRLLIDRLLATAQTESADRQKPSGYAVQVKSHNAVAAAVQQGRADWGVAIDTVAKSYGLEFIPLQEERYDFVVPKSRTDRPALRAFRELLDDAPTRQHLRQLGFRL